MYTGKKLLVVDDSDYERAFLEKILTSVGFEFFEAKDANEGIEKAISIMPDIILMDVVMPGMNGFQAVKQINMNDMLKNIPVILCTSKNQPTDKIWGTKQGAKAYVVKPIKQEILLEEIKKIFS